MGGGLNFAQVAQGRSDFSSPLSRHTCIAEAVIHAEVLYSSVRLESWPSPTARLAKVSFVTAAAAATASFTSPPPSSSSSSLGLLASRRRRPTAIVSKTPLALMSSACGPAMMIFFCLPQSVSNSAATAAAAATETIRINPQGYCRVNIGSGREGGREDGEPRICPRA